MATSLISEATAAQIAAVKAQAFATRKELGNVEMVTFYRDADDNAIPDAIGPYEVLIKFDNREQLLRTDPAASLVAVRGEFQSDDPDFDVRRNDRFELADGSTGQVRGAPIPNGAYKRAAFELDE